jgi:hypothetical protein
LHSPNMSAQRNLRLALVALACATVGRFAGVSAACASCGDVKEAAAECSKLGLGEVAALQSILLLNCPLALFPFGGDSCCSALKSFGWKNAENCLCGGQTGLSGLVISAKNIVESCGCTIEDARSLSAAVVAQSASSFGRAESLLPLPEVPLDVAE